MYLLSPLDLSVSRIITRSFIGLELYPAGKVAHVTCMFHANTVLLHAEYFLHVAIVCTCMFHVTCMDLGRFPCMLHS